MARPERILTQARLAVLPRPGATADMDTLTTALPTITSRLDWLDAEPIDLSSTELRAQRQRNETITHVPTAVQTYIQRHNLYSPPP